MRHFSEQYVVRNFCSWFLWWLMNVSLVGHLLWLCGYVPVMFPLIWSLYGMGGWSYSMCRSSIILLLMEWRYLWYYIYTYIPTSILYVYIVHSWLFLNCTTHSTWFVYQSNISDANYNHIHITYLSRISIDIVMIPVYRHIITISTYQIYQDIQHKYQYISTWNNYQYVHMACIYRWHIHDLRTYQHGTSINISTWRID